jgi:hypothetical protein
MIYRQLVLPTIITRVGVTRNVGDLIVVSFTVIFHRGSVVGKPVPYCMEWCSAYQVEEKPYRHRLAGY